jgi:hypothetical protein
VEKEGEDIMKKLSEMNIDVEDKVYDSIKDEVIEYL